MLEIAAFWLKIYQNAKDHCQNSKMDETDHRLLALLRQDARASIATLATRLKVSRGTITNRMSRLEQDGVIVGYGVRLRPDVQQNVIKAWACIAVEGNQTRAVIASLLGEPNVATLHDTNGRWDLLAELRADNLQDLGKTLERIRLIKGISSTETSIHLETYRLS
jgi:DNA-binding Lrp family transcriptional regulator